MHTSEIFHRLNHAQQKWIKQSLIKYHINSKIYGKITAQITDCLNTVHRVNYDTIIDPPNMVHRMN